MFVIKQLNLNKKNYLKLFAHNQYEKSIRKNHTGKNPNFPDIDTLFNNYITYHNKKIVLYFFKCELKLDFSILTAHNKTIFYQNPTNINFKRYFLNWIVHFTERRHKFFHRIEMNI